MKINNSYLRLYLDFLKFGCFTFGGGWSIIAQMQRQYTEKEKRITSEELMDLASMGNSIPGTMISNVAMLFGYRQAGFLGGIMCMLGMITAPVVIISIITYAYVSVKNDVYIEAAMSGVRSAVVPIIACSVYKLLNGAFRYRVCILLAAAIFVLQYFFSVSCVILVILGVVGGFVISVTAGTRRVK